jgi:hypothetical protein
MLSATVDACTKALHALYNAQELCNQSLVRYGGIIEEPHNNNNNNNQVCVRSGCYALIYLLKEFSGITNYLTC